MRRTIADLRGLFFWPMLAAILPWSLGYALLKRLAQRTGDFAAEADAASRGHRLVFGEEGDADWKFRYRLLRWVERTDTFLALMRPQDWWLRRVEVVGEWPAPGRAGLLLTYHWGAGGWIWRLLRSRGLPAYFVAKRPVVADLGASRVALWYGALRGWVLRRTGGLGLLYTGGSAPRIRAAMAARENVVAMLDLPVAPEQRAIDVAVAGRTARLPFRLIDIARDADPAISLLSCGFDFASGRRLLHVRTLPDGLSTPEVLQAYADGLSQCLARAPECWMMWHEAGAIFVSHAPSS